MTQPGYMIAVEGADKAGKHTQVMKIMDYLDSRGIMAETLDFPQYKSFFGEIIKKYLGGKLGNVHDLPAEYTMLPYALDRQQQQPKITQWINEGKWVILDRYTYSNSFSVAKCPRDQWDEKIKFMEDLEFNQMGIRRPDYNIYLYLDPQISYNMRNCGLKPHQHGVPDKHECDFKLLHNVSRVYKYLAQMNPRTWKVINEMTPSGGRMNIDEVFAQLRPVIDGLIFKQRIR